MDERESFFDSTASSWDQLLARDLQTEKLEALIDTFGIQEGDAVLGVGTGTGIFSPPWQNHRCARQARRHRLFTQHAHEGGFSRLRRAARILQYRGGRYDGFISLSSGNNSQ
jgi:hypothetical protein